MIINKNKNRAKNRNKDQNPSLERRAKKYPWPLGVPQKLTPPYLSNLQNSTKLARGVYCEFVAEEIFIKNSYQLLARSFKTPYAEIDRLFISPQREHVILEVKSIGGWSEVPAIHKGQKQRLHRVLEYFTAQLKSPVEIMYMTFTQEYWALYEETFETSTLY